MELTINPVGISQREVHLWYADPGRAGGDELVRRYQAMMSAPERDRQQRFVFEKDRLCYLVARGLVRTVLSHYTGVDPARWMFQANAYGKPEIAEPCGLAGLRFSLSHTAGLVACAVVLDREVGADAENVAREVPAAELARRYFSAAEAADVLSRPADRQLDRFYDYWTLKEAYAKARGLGLSIPLSVSSFELPPGGPIRVTFGPGINDESRNWQFAQLTPTPQHKIAVAARRQPGEDLEIIVHPGLPPAQPLTCRAGDARGPNPPRPASGPASEGERHP